MTHAYSANLRGRALARADRGKTIHSIAAEWQISASCVSQWRKLRRETGGHKKTVLTGANADWQRGASRHTRKPSGYLRTPQA